MATRTVDALRRGARAHSLLYAAYLGKKPDRRYDVTWEGHHYRRADASGARGTVTFSKQGVLAVFFDPKSPGAPAPGKKQKKLDDHLKGIPSALLTLARRETLATMDDGVGPVVTAAFWSTPQGELVGARPWPRLFEDGARLVETEMEKLETSIAAWTEQYVLDDAQAEVARRAFLVDGAGSPANARVVIPTEGRAALRLLPDQGTRELLEGALITLE